MADDVRVSTPSPTLITPFMDTKTYPGKGLSISQLVFALNEELKRTVYSPSCVLDHRGHRPQGHADIPCRFTLDEVLELNRDALAALATIREWINSFVPINRAPMEVLFLISTYLPSKKHRFRATFVCRHWRRTFLQNATLWSHLRLSKGEAYVEALLKRAKGSPLTILASDVDPVGTVMLLQPHTEQIADIEFPNNRWTDIQRFSEINSGPLPLLHTLSIRVVRGIDSDDPDLMTSSSHSLFTGAVGLKEFRLHSWGSPFLSHFIFPNLTSFELSVESEEQFRGSQLLDFLEASPMLQVAYMKIVAILSLGDIPRERVVVLQHVESFCLTASDGGPGYKLATHISCPSVKNTLLTHMGWVSRDTVAPPETFPTSDSLNAIIRQYTISPIEEVRIETTTGADFYHFLACSLTFRSADTTVIKLRFELSGYEDAPITRSVFTRACRAIMDLPLPANVKHLHVRNLHTIKTGSITQIAHDFVGILRSLGSLEELTIYNCDMRPWFPHNPEIVGYPPIRVLTLSDPGRTLRGDVAERLVGLAKARHRLGLPFERVTVRSDLPLVGVGERLKPWVGVVDRSLYDRS